jgi:hypothetical protein
MTFLVRVPVALAAIAFLISSGPGAYRTARGWVDQAVGVPVPTVSLSSPDRVEALVVKGKREQLISFRYDLEELAADATHRFYALGVGQVTLKSPEDIPDGEISVTGRSNTEELISTLPSVITEDYCERRAITGEFNNVLLFDKKQDAFTVVFDKRVAVLAFQTTCRATRPALILWAVEDDTNGNGTLGEGDREQLYLFALDDKTLHRIALDHMQVVNVWNVPDAGYILMQCQVDRDKDGQFGGYNREPTTIMRLDLKTMAMTPFVPADVVSGLQRILEGRGADTSARAKVP